jgi:hypothetical protein
VLEKDKHYLRTSATVLSPVEIFMGCTQVQQHNLECIFESTIVEERREDICTEQRDIQLKKLTSRYPSSLYTGPLGKHDLTLLQS